MNVLFLGYWGANEGLSQATINPHLSILCKRKDVKRIVYISIERNEDSQFQIPEDNKIIHIPYFSSHKSLWSKVKDFTVLPFQLYKVIGRYKIGLLMCRSLLAGSIGYLVHLFTHVPFTVESFEPHADYMADLNIWNTDGFNYKLQKLLEQKQIRHAFHIMPVSHKHAAKLKTVLRPHQLSTMPCAVNPADFQFSEEDRAYVRKQLNVSESATVTIYIGKFGGLYWDESAFQVFKCAQENLREFHLILLNPQAKTFINQRCEQFDIDTKSIHHFTVPHDDIPKYLSASDIAFSFHKPSKHSFAFSPIKNGEYWANGLPIVSSPNIGDDSEIISNESGGVLITDPTSSSWINTLQKKKIERGQDLSDIARRYRSFSNVEHIYNNMFEQLKYL